MKTKAQRYANLTTYSGAFTIGRNNLKKCLSAIYGNSYKSVKEFLDSYTFDDAEQIQSYAINNGIPIE